jgi:hypothetical protein
MVRGSRLSRVIQMMTVSPAAIVRFEDHIPGPFAEEGGGRRGDGGGMRKRALVMRDRHRIFCDRRYLI